MEPNRCQVEIENPRQLRAYDHVQAFRHKREALKIIVKSTMIYTSSLKIHRPIQESSACTGEVEEASYPINRSCSCHCRYSKRDCSTLCSKDLTAVTVYSSMHHFVASMIRLTINTFKDDSGRKYSICSKILDSDNANENRTGNKAFQSIGLPTSCSLSGETVKEDRERSD